MDNKSCIVCGMPLNKETRPQNSNEDIQWCMYCGTNDELYSYEELVRNMTTFIKNTQCLIDSEALEEAKSIIDNSPAYREGKIKSSN